MNDLGPCLGVAATGIDLVANTPTHFHWAGRTPDQIIIQNFSSQVTILGKLGLVWAGIDTGAEFQVAPGERLVLPFQSRGGKSGSHRIRDLMLAAASGLTYQDHQGFNVTGIMLP